MPDRSPDLLTQGRLLCTQRSGKPLHRIAGLHPTSYRRRFDHWGVRVCTTAGLHNGRVGIFMPLKTALPPQA